MVFSVQLGEMREVTCAGLTGRVLEIGGSLAVLGFGLWTVIKAASINTGIERRDNHLRSADFFDVAKYPEITFQSKKIEKKGKGLVAVGDFTMHGVTKEIALPFTVSGVSKDPATGKTTTARLLAKSLNCESGPSLTPCNACGPCMDITAGRDVDVQEIDGASNNSVDDVRRLQETLPFRPSRDRFKIVIVDEVHMLSTGAFNAFLKTLEEPPPHVKFIFATTEVHKVPVTILSRCQRYDFKLVPASRLAQHLTRIFDQEKLPIDPGAVGLLVRESGGSVRDALSLCDQIISYVGAETITERHVAEVLGVADRSLTRSLVRALAGGDAGGALAAVESAIERGVDEVIVELMGTARTGDELLSIADEVGRLGRAVLPWSRASLTLAWYTPALPAVNSTCESVLFSMSSQVATIWRAPS